MTVSITVYCVTADHGLSELEATALHTPMFLISESAVQAVFFFYENIY